MVIVHLSHDTDVPPRFVYRVGVHDHPDADRGHYRPPALRAV
jgi:hypothetical protein